MDSVENGKETEFCGGCLMKELDLVSVEREII